MATNDDWDRERALDRDFDREPTFGSRPRIPLNERGAVRVHIEKKHSDDVPTQRIEPETLAECARGWREQLTLAGLVQP